jgi:hypothetical protein
VKTDTTVAEWLDYCRRSRRDLSDDEFKALVPKFVALRRKLMRDMRAGERAQRAS